LDRHTQPETAVHVLAQQIVIAGQRLFICSLRVNRLR
jgi:hypothetical protein